MKKIVYILVFILLISIVTCYLLMVVKPLTSDRGRHSAEEVINEEDKVHLTFWRNFGNSAENEAYNELISDFETAHPNININMEEIEYSNYEVKLRTEIVTGTGPDIMAIDSPNLALYANSGILLSLDPFVEEDVDIKGNFPESIIEGLTYQNEIYLMPIVESSIALYYNRHIFEEAGVPFPEKSPVKPMTWEETIEIAKAVQNKEQGVYGIDPAQGFSNGESPAYFKLPFLWQFGASVLSPDGSTVSGYLDSEEALAALQFYQDLYHKEGVAALELPDKAFETNQLAMTVLGSWALIDLEKNGFILGEDFGVAPLPKADKQVVPNGSWALGISSKTEHPEEAWKFIRYVTSYEGMKKYVTITGDIPARYSVAEALPVFDEYPYNIFLHQAYYYSRNRPVTPAYPDISTAVKELFEDIGIANKDVGSSVDEAVETINKRLKEIE
ncbi:ABC-type glycerol-3-phosphate transport system, substrate-binding protein [Gracilibacillus orientalis]|uniref:ABC-type glycerol-3-phosphate transport system, substrate-binding protein n=1 Tax=Gracilibacillus orientalis TaxID=334253 RepID=A0A1I4HWJ3_9BACI|nr:ABC transporter substrate-binding protein [Gracilibacillus orientalis]SFL46434.1 ABC-type glycerol-3-phosphate transport system, substrate-binding protein [Gracilibacillus orientalis]